MVDYSKGLGPRYGGKAKEKKKPFSAKPPRSNPKRRK